jgi:hypothetical protein
MLINIEQFFICWLFISRKKAFTINKIIKSKKAFTVNALYAFNYYRIGMGNIGKLECPNLSTVCTAKNNCLRIRISALVSWTKIVFSQWRCCFSNQDLISMYLLPSGASQTKVEELLSPVASICTFKGARRPG